MNFVIKEWPDKSATLMNENGYALSTFDSVAEAEHACQQWRLSNGLPIASDEDDNDFFEDLFFPGDEAA